MKENVSTIDISDLVNYDLNSPKSAEVIKRIHNACSNTGFFTIVAHAVPAKLINYILIFSANFFGSSSKKKLKIVSQKWNKKNSNIYRQYFPSSVNGKEGLDIGDSTLKNSMYEILRKERFKYLNLKTFLDNKSILIINKYFDCLFSLGKLLFKSIVKSFEADINIVNKAFVRPKTLTTLRFNYYPKQKKPVEISEDYGERLRC